MSSVDTTERDRERPACGVSRQCSEKSYRRLTARAASTFEPCQNSECFGDDEPDPGDDVLVAHGRASNSMHRPTEP